MKSRGLVLTFGLICAGMALPAAARKPDPIEVQAQRSLPQIEQYVARVDNRLQKGNYDVLKPKDRAWVAAQVANLNTQLKATDRAGAVPVDLQVQVNLLETRMINLEEGGIVCERSARTGSRMAERRCMTRKRKDEIREESLRALRTTNHPGLPSGG